MASLLRKPAAGAVGGQTTMRSDGAGPGGADTKEPQRVKKGTPERFRHACMRTLEIGC